jgi:hypothetical protein
MINGANARYHNVKIHSIFYLCLSQTLVNIRNFVGCIFLGNSMQRHLSRSEHMAVYITIIGKTLVSLTPTVRTRKCYDRAGQQKSFQGLVVYGHEVHEVICQYYLLFCEVYVELNRSVHYFVKID